MIPPQPNTGELTGPELAAWLAVEAAANAILPLREVHQSERAEAVTHIHALQTSLLARVAYPVITRIHSGTIEGGTRGQEGS